MGTLLAELQASDSGGEDGFGQAVAISGTTAVMGAVGAAPDGRAYVFTETAAGWKQTAELKGSDTAEHFGVSTAISGTTVVVGALGNGTNDAGRAYVFTKTASGWKQVAKLKGSDTMAADSFGRSVAVSGTTVVVGAYGHAQDTGRAYVFTKTAAGWKQAAELKGSDSVGDYFGFSVAISGTTAVVGAWHYGTGEDYDAGRAYVFTKATAGWKQVAELKGSDTVGDDQFGGSVAISGTTAVVGEYQQQPTSQAGRAYVFTKTAAGWRQAAELKGSDTIVRDGFGYSVAISGTTAVVAAPGHASGSGRVYVFTKVGTDWRQVAELKDSRIFGDDSFGISVAIAGTTALVGALLWTCVFEV
jgi:nucleoside-specific outer membrane channel protein Tsx